MGIDLIPKQPAAKSILEEVFFSASLILAIVAAGLAFLFWNIEKSAVLESAKLAEDLAKEKTEEQINLENKIFRTQKTVSSFKEVILLRKEISPVFDLLEKLVHSQVYFSKTNFIVEDGKIWLSGKSDSFQALGEQLSIFDTSSGRLEGDPRIEKADLIELGIGKEGGIDFGLEILIK